MKKFMTNFSASHLAQSVQTGGMLRSIGAKLMCCVTLLLLSSGTLFAQLPYPEIEIRMMNLRYEPSYTIASWTGPAIVFNIEMKAGAGYIDRKWPFISSEIMIEYKLGPGVVINPGACRTANPVPNLANVGSLFCGPYAWTFLYPTALNAKISRTYNPANLNQWNFAGSWINCGTFAIPVLAGTPDWQTEFKIIPYNNSSFHSFWGTGETAGQGLPLPFAHDCPIVNYVGVDPHPVFDFDTLRFCYGDTGPKITLPLQSINTTPIPGTWEKAGAPGVPVTVVETSPTFAPGVYSDTTDYVFIPDNPLYCSFTSSIIILPPTDIVVNDIDDVCTGTVDLTQAITPGATDIADYKFYECTVCDGGDYTPVPSDVTLPTTAAMLYYARYEPSDTCPSSYIPFWVTLIQSPDAPVFSTVCTAGVISQIEVTHPLGGDNVYSLDGIIYQDSPLFTGLSGTAYALYVKDTVNLCVTRDSVLCPPCPDMPAINITNSGTGSICIGSGNYIVQGTLVHATAATVTHNGAGGLTITTVSPSFTVGYIPVAGDVGNTVTLTFKIDKTATCPDVIETVAFVVNGLPAAVTIDSTFQQFCDGAVIDDLDASGLGIVWYNQPTGGSVLPGSWPLKHDSTYYATQVLPTGCESSVRSAVQAGIIDVTDMLPPDVEDQFMCTDGALVMHIITDGTPGIAIYENPTGGAPMLAGDALSHGVTYYAGYSFGAGACESEARTPFLVEIDDSKADDPVIADQIFCDGATIANIAVPTTGIVWFAPGTGGVGTPLTSDTELLSGVNTYYARQTKGGSCLESDPVPVEITVGGSAIPPPIIHGPDYFCSGATLGNINVSGFGVTWYDDPIAGLPLPFTFELPIGVNQYYAEQSSGGGCASATRAMIEVTVANCGDLLDCATIPDRPAGEDSYMSGVYTHTGTAWNVALGDLDSIRYFIDGSIPAGPLATLHNAVFPLGVSTVMVVGHSGVNTDTCYFDVTVTRACPLTIPGIGGYTYTVTSLAGMCWTSNMRNTLYENGTPIAWAELYQSSLYSDVAHHDSIFGRLYTWESAIGTEPPSGAGHYQGICPVGWHVPSQAEWALLSGFDANDLRSTNYWVVPGGTDAYGFDSRPAGRYDSATGMFIDLYGYTGYWASDDTSATTAHTFIINYYCNNPEITEIIKADGLSVRCVMD